MNRIVALCAVLLSGCTLHVSRPPAPFTESAILLAKDSLDLPSETPVILVGISRGAGLVSIAAGQEAMRNQLVGIIAIALGDVEEHVMHRRRGAKRSEWVAVETYRYLRQLVDLPIEIIQST